MISEIVLTSSLQITLHHFNELQCKTNCCIIKVSDRKNIRQSRKTPFSGSSGDASITLKVLISGHQRPIVLRLNIEDLTSNEINFRHHLTLQHRFFSCSRKPSATVQSSGSSQPNIRWIDIKQKAWPCHFCIPSVKLDFH